ncbi:MAG: hypothetical protein JRI23_12180 [Deltaproteobacteria bacterium]|jgi:hypothetical protein|nr:hypothetical protein [Deltaproteobacteria bacterium]MBW2532469.1 hypothetical protein [Deltaproteobacteria bacterium]
MRLTKLHAAMVVLLTPGLFAFSCDDPELEAAVRALGEGCLINSDCEANLICVFRRCHIQCQVTPDCPTDSTGKQLNCMLGTQPEHVCQLEEEKYCSYNSDCPEGQQCSTDGECRDQCAGDRDCTPGQVCSRGSCACQDELDPTTNELPMSTAPDGQQTGMPCAYKSHCSGLAPADGPAFGCVDGVCTFECYDNVDCHADERCIPDDGDGLTPGECVRATDDSVVFCVPGQQVACDCLDGGAGVQICSADGSGYESCTQDGTNPC